MAKLVEMQKTLWFSVCKLSLKLCGPKDKDVFNEAKTKKNVCHKTVTVTETDLPEGSSTRKIVETIFRSSWLRPGLKHVKVERVVKINLREDNLSRFEEYRETMKRKYGEKCTRCMADGNEMLRFHGTTIMCSLNVINGVVKPCSLKGCNVCNILRAVFSYKCRGSLSGIYTTASSGLAHDSINIHCQNNAGSTTSLKRGMLVCRVIAGHVHKPLYSHGISCWKQVGIDSVSAEGGRNCKPEEPVFQSNARAFLPCFLILYSLIE